MNAGSDGYNDGSDQTYVPEVAWALQERDAKGADSSTKEGHLIPVAAPLDPKMLQSHAYGDGTEANLIAFSGKDHGADAGELSPTLRAMPHDQSHENGGGQVAVAFCNTAGNTALGMSKAGCPPITSRHGDPGHLLQGMMVRRLTPTECERLQGFPDGWTSVFSDSVRYRMLGNAVPPPMVEWIGIRVLRSEPPAASQSRSP